MVIADAPHPARLQEVMKHPFKYADQLFRRSWYAWFLATPHLAEIVLHSQKAKERFLENLAFRGDSFFWDVKQAYLEQINRDGGLTAIASFYRAQKIDKKRTFESSDVDVKVLWGSRDAYLDPNIYATGLEGLYPNLDVENFDSTHWLALEKPDETLDAILRHLESDTPMF
jgi:pimeloyl-ACP methyl ester carboxylesterase